MAMFSQKGHDIDADEVESVSCKDGKTRWRRSDNKTWVKVLSFYRGTAHVRLQYKSSRKWHNRVFEVTFEFVSYEGITEEHAADIAYEILTEEDDAYDFINQKSVIGFEQTQQTIEEDDLSDIRELDRSGSDYHITSSKVDDLKGWGESE